jgi:hypothetical protein
VLLPGLGRDVGMVGSGIFDLTERVGRAISGLKFAEKEFTAGEGKTDSMTSLAVDGSPKIFRSDVGCSSLSLPFPFCGSCRRKGCNRAPDSKRPVDCFRELLIKGDLS